MINTEKMKQILKLSSGVVLESVANIGGWISSPEGAHFVPGAIYPDLFPLLLEGTRTEDELASATNVLHGYAIAYNAIAVLERLGVLITGNAVAFSQTGESGLPDTRLAETANWVAAARAEESRRADRLFDDPLADQLAGEAGFSWLKAHPDAATTLAIRTRFFDDFLAEATLRYGIRQVVIIASGFDMRTWRIEWPEGVRLFELDRKELLTKKCSIAEAAGALSSCRPTFIGTDLTADWKNFLLDKSVGFDPATPSAWLIEGLLVYLDDWQVGHLIDDVTMLSAAGSRIGIDLASRAILDPRRNFAFLKELRVVGCPWRFGTDEPNRLLEERGWEAAVCEFEEAEKRYGRRTPLCDGRIPREPKDGPSFFLVTGAKMPEGECLKSEYSNG